MEKRERFALAGDGSKKTDPGVSAALEAVPTPTPQVGRIAAAPPLPPSGLRDLEGDEEEDAPRGFYRRSFRYLVLNSVLGSG